MKGENDRAVTLAVHGDKSLCQYWRAHLPVTSCRIPEQWLSDPSHSRCIFPSPHVSLVRSYILSSMSRSLTIYQNRLTKPKIDHTRHSFLCTSLFTVQIALTVSGNILYSADGVVLVVAFSFVMFLSKRLISRLTNKADVVAGARIVT